ncbi:Lipase and/or Abhydrolase 6 domain containing protein [Asbolus verrucosus]|uniref:Lipase and/or Abhydrolase 6 domain containing protein n=1 Tax=Asbolus verrucosus TaxID=1661398 RepID=A0A482W898_ASBVE|nr:Lipase and/or Abhydrolase 6 domain containing protein [Asbolus verrucosus]
MSSIHMIGHSMGAQVAAFAGHKLQLDINQTIDRITGLDPAAPLYEWPHVESLDEILDPGDASFVDDTSITTPTEGNISQVVDFSWDEYLAGNTDGLVAVPMGIAANPSIPYGSYFLETTDEEKFFLKSTTTILDSFSTKERNLRIN